MGSPLRSPQGHRVCFKQTQQETVKKKRKKRKKTKKIIKVDLYDLKTVSNRLWDRFRGVDPLAGPRKTQSQSLTQQKLAQWFLIELTDDVTMREGGKDREEGEG